jgi:hypothetical protein
MKIPIFLIPALVLALPAAANTVKIHGSDLLSPWAAEYLLQSPSLKAEGIKPDFVLRGSYAGKAAVKNGYADACFYLESTPSDIPAGYRSELIAYHVLYIYAPESFPDYSIDKDAIVRMAAEGHHDPIFSWGDLFPDVTEWQSKQPHILINPGPKNIWLGIFQQKFMDGHTLQNGPETQVKIGRLEEVVLESDAFIYVTAEASIPREGFKRLALKDFGDTAAFAPNEETIRYEDYGAVVPLYLFVPIDAPWSDQLVNACASDGFKKLLRAHNLYPVE